MARTTVALNLKGGVAKTTTVINMAAMLAKYHGKRVLVIDADPQCNTTEFLFGGDPGEFHLAAMLRDADFLATTCEGAAKLPWYVVGTEYDGIDMICADDSLMDLDLTKVETRDVNVNILRYLLCEVGQDYDYVLIDCPPAFNAAAAAALVAADDVIIPIKLDAFSLRGMGNLMRQIRNMKQINPRLKLAGILPTMWYRDDQATQAEQQLIDAGFHVFPHIRATRKVDAMTWAQEPLTVCSPRCAAGRDYKKFVEAYLNQEIATPACGLVRNDRMTGGDTNG